MAVVDQNYPNLNDLLVVDSRNNPIEGAEIRIFDRVAFESGDTDTWVALTTTNADGKWVDPVILEDGRSWVIHVQKSTEYGPTHIELDT